MYIYIIYIYIYICIHIYIYRYICVSRRTHARKLSQRSKAQAHRRVLWGGHRPTLGPYGEAISDARGTPVIPCAQPCGSRSLTPTSLAVGANLASNLNRNPAISRQHIHLGACRTHSTCVGRTEYRYRDTGTARLRVTC